MNETVQYVIVGLLIAGAILAVVIKTVRLFARKGSGCASCPPGCSCPKSKSHDRRRPAADESENIKRFQGRN